MLGPSLTFPSGPSIVFLKLLVDKTQHRPSRVLVCKFLKGFDQTKHLKIFDAWRHGKDLIKMTGSNYGKIMQRVWGIGNVKLRGGLSAAGSTRAGGERPQLSLIALSWGHSL